MALVRIPPVLRPSVGGEREVTADGDLNRYVNVYLNDEDVRVLDGLETSVSDSDTIVILPAMAGGSR